MNDNALVVKDLWEIKAKYEVLLNWLRFQKENKLCVYKDDIDLILVSVGESEKKEGETNE
jgi:hypothetical protein